MLKAKWHLQTKIVPRGTIKINKKIKLKLLTKQKLNEKEEL